MYARMNRARPKLSIVSPLAARIIFGFAICDVLLGISLFLYPQTSAGRLAVVGGIFTLVFYASIFVLVGLSMLAALKWNDWRFIRTLMIGRLLLQSIWLYAFAVLTWQSGSPVLLTLWAFLTYVQAVTYVYFLPEKMKLYGNP